MNRVSFTEKNGKTSVTASGGPINETGEERAIFEAAFENMPQGFSGTDAPLIFALQVFNLNPNE